MARIALALLCLAIVLGTTGCTWTETYRDFPPGVSDDDHQDHDHQHDHDGD